MAAPSPVRARDVDAFHAFRADPEVARFQSWHDYTRDRTDRSVRSEVSGDPGVSGEAFQLSVARLDDDALVGNCMLALDASAPPNAEIGYTVGTSASWKRVRDRGDDGPDRIRVHRPSGEPCDEQTYEIARGAWEASRD